MLLISVLVKLLFITLQLWLILFQLPKYQLLSCFLSRAVAQAAGPPLVDPSLLLFAEDFEHDLAKWQQVRGSPDHWQLTDDGQLEAYIPGFNTISEWVPNDQFWQDEWLNYRYQFRFTVLTTADVNFSWGFKNTNNWYELHFYGGRYHLVRLRNGTVVFRYSGLHQLKLNHQYQVTIIFNQGRVQAWLDDETLLDRQDTSYTGNGGKISLKATTGAAWPTRVLFDQVRVYALEEDHQAQIVFLPQTEFKQYSLPWRDWEYDHALSWQRWGNWRELTPNNPPDQVTMYHWGCATTSLAMVMRYHQLDKLPDSKLLDPGSLNAWLKREADGYTDWGGINWLAGTRLSRLISEAHSTTQQALPKLEFQRYHSQLPAALYEINHNLRPGIIQIPGHFLVGQGYLMADGEAGVGGELPTDFFISDPAFSHHLLSQHEQPMVSVIDLQPTHSNLSYLMITTEPGVQLQLTDEQGQIVTELEPFQDSLVNPFYERVGCGSEAPSSGNPDYCAYHQSMPVGWLLSQPEVGSYTLSFEASEPGLHRVKLYLYDRQAEVRLVDRWLVADEEGGVAEVVHIEFNQDSSDLVEVVGEGEYDLSLLADQTTQLYQQGELSPELYLRLMEVARWAKQASGAKAADRYRQLWLRLVSEFQDENDFVLAYKLTTV